MKKNVCLTLACTIIAFAGENLQKNGNAADGLEGWSEAQMTLCNETPHSGNACFQTISKLPVLNTQIIPVDATKKHLLRFWLRTLDGKPVEVYLLIRALDKDKKPIPAQNITIVKDTDTELAAPCKAADTIVYVKDGSKFRCDSPIHMLAFQTKPDLSDLPNGNLSKGIITKVEKKGNQWAITLNKPCGFDLPAGTAVREQRHSAAFMYPFYQKNFSSKEWMKIERIIYRESACGATSQEFWKGTKYIQLGINPRNGAMLCVDDIELLQLDK